MATKTSPEFERAKKAKEEAVKKLLSPDSPNHVVGVGIGEGSGVFSLRIYVLDELSRVASKLGQLQINSAKLVPDTFQGIPTDVIPTQRFGRQGNKPRAMLDTNQPPTPSPQPGSPIRLQTIAANVNSGAIGTLGMLVAAAGNKYILGCNHILAANGRVLADPNAELLWAQFVGDQETIADPVVYVPLDRKSNNNEVDCALARLRNDRNIQAIFPKEIRALTSPEPIDPNRGMPVSKVGSSTGATKGTIVDVDADLYVDYSFGTFRFTNQVIVKGDNENFATAGDSGSILVHTDDKEKKTQAVGMVFAGSGQFAIACKLQRVLDELQKQMPSDSKARLGNGKVGNDKLKLLIS